MSFEYIAIEYVVINMAYVVVYILTVITSAKEVMY